MEPTIEKKTSILYKLKGELDEALEAGKITQDEYDQEIVFLLSLASLGF